jgi:micrococcal nuclease
VGHEQSIATNDTAGTVLVFFILIGATSPEKTTKSDTVSNQKQEVGHEQSIATNDTPIKDTTQQIQQQDKNVKKIIPANNELYSVIKIVDGDTIAVNLNGKSETLRLIGIDTPEIVDPRKVVECFGKEASNKAKEILTGKKVRLETDPISGERDKYDRLLRYVFLENGISFNKLMISEGFAYEYTYNGIPYKYQAEFKQAQKEAESAKRGLWAYNACNTTPTSQTIPSNSSTSKPTITPGIDKDCKDFKTHTEAQAYFEAGGGSSANNFDRLDSDGDGQACEGLP